MANELDDALAAIVAILREIDGLRNTPDFSPEAPTTFPLLVVSAGEGQWIKESSGQLRGLHKVRIGVYVPRKDLQRDIELVMPFGELIKDKLLVDENAHWSDTITTYDDEPVTYTFGPVNYAGSQLVGWTFSVPIKIRSIQVGTEEYIKG